MTAIPPLIRHWLQHHGEASPDSAARSAWSRSQRYSTPIRTLYPHLVNAVDRLAPPLLLHTRSRASELSPSSFDQLEHKLQHHPQLLVRLAYLLVRSPLIETRYPDITPPIPSHPLEALAPVIQSRDTHTNRHFDVVIIGSGAGGAPLARALSEAGQSVAIVESGSLLTAAPSGKVLEKWFMDQGIVGSVRGGGTVLAVAGNAVGGTTVINSGTSLRPRTEQLEAWDREAGTSFAQGDLNPYLDQVHSQINITTIPEHLLDASSKAVRRGLDAIGRTGSFALPRNASGCEGHGRCCFGCPSGAKLSTDRAYLPQAIHAGATLLAQTRATAIREDRSGVSILLQTPTGTRSIRAKQLVISAGALSTPNLLRKNQLGDRWKIAGNNLRIHPATKVFGLMPEPLAHGGVPQALGYRAPELPRVTFEGAHTPPALTATVLTPAGKRHRWWMDQHEQIANYGLMIRDRSVGSVRIRGGQRMMRYALHPDDALDIGAGLLIAAEALFAAGAERVALPLAGREPEVASIEALRKLGPADFPTQNLMTSGFHPQGTAGIGRVVDKNLTLSGSKRIHVCDASVLTNSPGVNPQVTIMALSLRLADRLQGSL